MRRLTTSASQKCVAEAQLLSASRKASSFFKPKAPAASAATTTAQQSSTAAAVGDAKIAGFEAPPPLPSSSPVSSAFAFKAPVALEKKATSREHQRDESIRGDYSSSRASEGLRPQTQRSDRVASGGRRRTFARPVYADDVAEAAPPTGELAPVGDDQQQRGMTSGSRKGDHLYGGPSRQQHHRSGDKEDDANTTNRPTASYAEVEAAIMDHMGADVGTSSHIAKRVSREGRLAAAQLDHAITRDDPIMHVKDRMLHDEADYEMRAAEEAARRDRIRVEGVTGHGIDGTSAGRQALHETIPLTADQQAAQKVVEKAAAGPTIGIEQLTPMQKELVWEERKQIYSVVHRQILIALESHHSQMDKLLLLMELHDLIIKKGLRLRTEIYVDILATAYSALTSAEHTVVNNRSKITMLDELWVMYEYCVDSGSDPTPKLIQNMMRILGLGRVADTDVEAKAHRLMIDSDRFKLIPTDMCLSTYFVVCGYNNAMHLAVTRFADAKMRYEVIPTASMIKAIMDGLRRCGKSDDALKFLATVSNVSVTSELFATVLHCARDSSSPLSVFTFYKSLRQTDLRPDVRIINTMLRAQDAADDYSNTKFIMGEVMRFRVRLETDTLNRMLMALEKAELETEFCKLYVTMRRNGKNVYMERYSPKLLDLAKAFETRMSSQRRMTGGEGHQQGKKEERGGSLLQKEDRPNSSSGNSNNSWRSSHGAVESRRR